MDELPDYTADLNLPSSKNRSAKQKIADYLVSSGDTVSAFLNNLIFFANDGNQSISGRCDDEKDKFFWKKFGHLVDGLAYGIFGQENHCRKAAVRDTKRALERVRKFPEHLKE